MLFWILVLISIAIFLSFIFYAITSYDKEMVIIGSFIITIILCVFSAAPIISYQNHASDLATINEQGRVISVYEERKESLEKTLNSFKYPENISLMNGDSPIASIVKQLSETESDIASAKKKQAEAYINIEGRKLGLMSGVLWFFD